MRDWEIDLILKNNSVTKEHYWGCHPCNALPQITGYPRSFVLNLDELGDGGSHWVGVYAPDPQNVWYFDSLGLGPNECVFNTLTRTFKKFVRNIYPFQKMQSTCCGYYAIYFIYKCSLGFNIIDIVRELRYNIKGNCDYFVRRAVNKM